MIILVSKVQYSLLFLPVDACEFILLVCCLSTLDLVFAQVSFRLGPTFWTLADLDLTGFIQPPANK